MKILVCISHVPDTTTKIAFTDNDTKLNTTGVQYIVGPYEDLGLARAIELKEAQGATITVLNVGEADTEPTIRKALAVGADDAIRVNAKPTDAYYVAQQIAEVAKEGAYDMILMGRETIDYNGGTVHGLVGEMLGIPSISPVMKLDVAGNTATLARQIEGGKETMEVNFPFIAGCQEPIAEWKIPNMRGIMSARTKPLKVLQPVDASAMSEVINYQLPAQKGAVKMIPADQAVELIGLLRNEAKVL